MIRIGEDGTFCVKHAGNLTKHPSSSLDCYRFCGCHRALYHPRGMPYSERKRIYGKSFHLAHGEGQWLERIALEPEVRDFCENDDYADLWLHMAAWFAVFNDNGNMSSEKFEYRIRRVVEKPSARLKSVLYSQRKRWLWHLKKLFEEEKLTWYHTMCVRVLDDTSKEQREELKKKAFETKKLGAMRFKEKLQQIEKQQAIFRYASCGNFTKYKMLNSIDKNSRSKGNVYGVGFKVKPSYRELREMFDTYSQPCHLPNGWYVYLTNYTLFLNHVSSGFYSNVFLYWSSHLFTVNFFV